MRRRIAHQINLQKITGFPIPVHALQLRLSQARSPALMIPLSTRENGDPARFAGSPLFVLILI